eukprot:TRINITY_DN9816_c0_g2_i4.p1 TRINITY_DN9816_c0_g2~~TRINITY_DN9816_c0_g2_i4.p1  ORF type:complete len:706 (-),score=90.54 TRINITY_DN9816_c0_g2_i4:1289-3406(-)
MNNQANSDNLSNGEILTRPSAAVSNCGRDNANSDLILRVGDRLQNAVGEEFVIQGLLGQGTYGQVARCIKSGNEIVAIKVIKNQPAYLNQAQIEVSVLQMLNHSCDPDDEHHIVRLYDTFMFANHLCLVFELLRLDLFQVIQKRRFKGLDLHTVCELLRQMLDCLEILRDAGVIHSDLKPENVLIQGWSPINIKVIDFGSACYENRTVYQYVQSRFYRSPEVILGSPPYTAAIDMWSLGCVAAELFLGLPLFPGAGGFDMIDRITQAIRAPPEHVIQQSKFGAEFMDGPDEQGNFRVLTIEQYKERNGKDAAVGKNYFEGEKLEDIIFKWGMERQNSSSGREQLDSFLDFLYGILDPDPETRWTPRQALQHPFIKKESFLGPFVPQPDPIRPHIRQQGYQNQQGQDFAGSLGNMQWSLAQQAQILAQAQTLAMLQFSPGSQQFTTGSLQQLSHLQSQIVGSFSNNFSAGSFPVGNNLLMPNVLSTSTPQHGVMPTLGSAYQYLPLGASFQQMTQLLQQHQFQQQQQQQLQQQQQEQQSQSQQPPQLSLSQQQQLLQQHQQQHMSQSSCSSFNQLHSSLTPEFGYGTSQNTPLAMHTKHAQHVSELKKMNSSTRRWRAWTRRQRWKRRLWGKQNQRLVECWGNWREGAAGRSCLHPRKLSGIRFFWMREKSEKKERTKTSQRSRSSSSSKCSYSRVQGKGQSWGAL